jgi:hypothetical protein
MLNPARFDIEVWRNAIFPPDTYTLTDSTTGLAVDISSYTMSLEVRLYDGADGSALISLLSTSGSGDRIIKTDAAAGEFQISIAEATMDDLPAPTRRNEPVKLRWDFRVNTGGGFEVYWFGDFIVHGGVDR